MEADLLARLIDRATVAIRDHAEELTRLDQAIGDGDHGLNMSRGFAAMAEQRDALAALPFGAALQKAGMTLVMKVGGASGPLYGSLLMAMGKAGEAVPAGADALARVLEQGIEAVKQRGKSDVGAKTMLDVLVPTLRALRAGAEQGLPQAELAAAVRAAAREALQATAPLRATKGRASFLGERSIGHIDPGARSSALLIEVVCDIYEEVPA